MNAVKTREPITRTAHGYFIYSMENVSRGNGSLSVTLNTEDAYVIPKTRLKAAKRP